MTPILLRHLSHEPIGRFPVWLMRQAGRFLPRYQAIRKNHAFWKRVTTPQIAAEVSLLPLEVLEVDAVILFSDILTLPYGLGVPIEMKEGAGPTLERPFVKESDFGIFERFDPKKHTPFVGETLSILSEKIPEEKTLIGFAGAPWSVACYLMGGTPHDKFVVAKRAMYERPKELADALKTLANATRKYVEYQITHGAQLIQLFDTWVSEMPREFFVEYYAEICKSLLRDLRASKVPLIYYSKGTSHLLPDLASLPCDILGVDSLLPLPRVEALTLGAFSLQGNLDPLVLLGSEARIRFQTRRLVGEARTLKHPPILNLGHGVCPTTPVKNVRLFLQEAGAPWI